MVTFDFALDTIMQLSEVEREDLIEIVRKRKTEAWRKETAIYYNQLKEEIEIGLIKPVDAVDAVSELHEFMQIEG
jgi:hypothetical protein